MLNKLPAPKYRANSFSGETGTIKAHRETGNWKEESGDYREMN
jgi:hypothetical protein